jgi:hypothetical protein
MTMLNNTVLHGPTAGEVALITQRRRPNPWVSDQMLLSISLWWVQNTRPGCPDFASEVGAVLRSLQQDLQ